MGREIRRVPSDWEHPKNRHGYIPLHDETHKSALAEWEKEKAEFDSVENAPERERILQKYGDATFEEWHGERPDPEYYRQEFESEPTHYQVYETVTEGTPTSPVFASLDGMKGWLIGKGFSDHAASMFAEIGWAPSMVFTPGRGGSRVGIHSLDHLPAG